MLRLAPLALLLLAADAHAYVRTTSKQGSQACLYWPAKTVVFGINELGSQWLPDPEGEAAVRAGFDAWQGWSCTDFSYAYGGKSKSFQVGYNRVLVSQPALARDVDNPHLVVFRAKACGVVVPPGDDCLAPDNDDCDNKYNCWPDHADNAGDALAYTLVTSEVSTGRILDADTAFDEVDFEFRDLATQSCDDQVDGDHCADLQNTMAHEAGHFLGLAHSDVLDATMYYRVVQPFETLKRDLDSDDVAGLCAIYPAGAPPVSCVPQPPVEVVAQGCTCGLAGGPGAAALAAALLLLRARRAKPRWRG